MASPSETIDDSKTGYRVFDFGVSGMHCANCATRLEKALQAIPGVRTVTVNAALESARVEMEVAVRIGTLEAATTKAGYTAHLDAHNTAREEADLKRDFLLSAVLTLPLVLQMLFPFTGTDLHLPAWAQFLLALPVQLYVARRFYLGAWISVRNRAANMDVLVVMGTGAAFIYSVYLFAVGETEKGLYFEAAAVIITLVLLGKLLESRAKDKATSAIHSLLSLAPVTARRLLSDGSIEEIPVARVRVGDTLHIPAGDTIPVDGRVLKGAADLDEKHLTGESMPVHRGQGDMVSTGSGNVSGALTIEATAVGKDTRLAKIVDLVRTAQSQKAPIQKLVDKISAVFVPAIVSLAVISFGAWIVSGAALEQAVTAGVSVLIIACPCALGLAAPAAIAAGLGAAARSGIFISDLDVVERAKGTDTVIFDKTGTLTSGNPKIESVDWRNGVEVGRSLMLAAAVQKQNRHPLGRPFIELDHPQPLSGIAVEDFRTVPGKGVTAIADGKAVVLGNTGLLADFEIEVPEAFATSDEPGTNVFLAIEGKFEARFRIVDSVRAESMDAVSALNRSGRKTILLSGDTEPEARRIADLVGIDAAAGDMGPEQKSEYIQDLHRNGKRVAMIGDGINDAPALAIADVGIAMGDGAEVAIRTAGITLMRPDPRLAASALEIAAKTVSKIRQNLFWAFVYNVIGLPLAALGYLNPALAGAAMAMSSVCVVGNAILLTKWRPKIGILSA